MSRTCSMDGCERSTWGRMDICQNHYARKYRTGSPEGAMALRQTRLAERREADERRLSGRAIPDHHGFYATPDGRIFTVLQGAGFRDPRELRQHLNKGGYPVVRLRGKTWTVHRLVALAFIGPPPPGMHTRHLDGDRTNAAIWNLTYGTPAENSRDRIMHGTMPYGEKAPQSRWTDAQVREAVALYHAGGITQREIGERYGTSQATVSGWIKGAELPGPKRYRRAGDLIAAGVPE